MNVIFGQKRNMMAFHHRVNTVIDPKGTRCTSKRANFHFQFFPEHHLMSMPCGIMYMMWNTEHYEFLRQTNVMLGY